MVLSITVKKMVNSYVWFHRDIQQFENSCINENFSDDKTIMISAVLNNLIN